MQVSVKVRDWEGRKVAVKFDLAVVLDGAWRALKAAIAGHYRDRAHVGFSDYVDDADDAQRARWEYHGQ